MNRGIDYFCSASLWKEGASCELKTFHSRQGENMTTQQLSVMFFEMNDVYNAMKIGSQWEIEAPIAQVISDPLRGNINGQYALVTSAGWIVIGSTLHWVEEGPLEYFYRAVKIPEFNYPTVVERAIAMVNLVNTKAWIERRQVFGHKPKR